MSLTPKALDRDNGAAWLRGIFTAWQKSGCLGELTVFMTGGEAYVILDHDLIKTAKLGEISGTPYALGIKAFEERGDWSRL